MASANNLKRNANICLDLTIHFIISLEIFLIFFLKFENIFLIIPSFLGGILIDFDHILDCFFNFGRVNFKLLCDFPYRKPQKVFLFFHSWELVILFSALAYFYFSLFFQVFAFSWGMHLLVDNLDGAKKKGFCHYFLIYRLRQGFKIENLKGFVF